MRKTISVLEIHIGLHTSIVVVVVALLFYVVVALLFYVHGKQLRSCRDGQLT